MIIKSTIFGFCRPQRVVKMGCNRDVEVSMLNSKLEKSDALLHY